MLLLRHGQSTWNAEGRWQGQADPPLSAQGEAAARAAADAFGDDAFAAAGDARLGPPLAAVSSDLSRARQTAEILAARLGWGPVTTFRGLRERHVGQFTGHNRAEIEARWPGLLAAGFVDPPGAEPRPSLLARAVATLHRVASLHPARAVVAVTHGGLIRAVEHHLGVGDAAPHANLAGRWVEVDDGRLVAGPAITLAPPAPLAAAAG